MQIVSSVGPVLCVVLVLASPARGDGDVDALMDTIQNGGKRARIGALEELGDMGNRGEPAVSAIVPLLRVRNAQVRQAAAGTLWKIEGRPERVVPTLIAIVESKGRVEKAGGAAKPKGEPRKEESAAAHAAELLGKIGPEARQAVPALIEAVESRDSFLVGCAIEALGEIGPDARRAIPAIVEHLGDDRIYRRTFAGTWYVGSAAWCALGEMGPDAAVALIPALTHRDKDVRRRAALALEYLGPDAAPALEALAASLRDKDERVRRYSADAIGEIGSSAQSALPMLLGAADDPASRVREAVVDALPRVAPESPEVLVALIAALEDPDGTVEAHAVMSLGRLGAAARPAVPLMAKMLRSEKDYFTGGHPGTLRPIRDCVASVLGDLGPVADEAVGALVQAADGDRHTWEAIPAIAKIGPKADAALPFLLRERTPEAVAAIARIDPDNDEVMAILSRHWQSADRLWPERKLYHDRSWCYVLGRFGPRAKPAIPALEELLGADYWRCRISSALTLLEIDPTHERALDVCLATLKQRSAGFPEVGRVTMGDFLESGLEERLDRLMGPLGPRARVFVPTLCEILTNPGGSARISAAECLAAIGPEAEGAAPALIQALGSRRRDCSRSDDVRSAAVESLARIGAAAVPSLVEALEDEDVLIRAGACDTLGRIGSDAASAVPALIEALGDERMAVRAASAMAVEKLGPTADAAVPALVRALGDEYYLVRRSAAGALGTIGNAARAATGAIENATRDECLGVRQAARATLRKIGAQAAPRQ